MISYLFCAGGRHVVMLFVDVFMRVIPYQIVLNLLNYSHACWTHTRLLDCLLFVSNRSNALMN